MKLSYCALSASAFLATVAVAFVSLPAAAEVEYPWCSRSSVEYDGMPDCRYSTYEQCQANAVYLNGWCERNARVVWREQQARRGVR
jgi:hypothetical protein